MFLKEDASIFPVYIEVEHTQERLREVFGSSFIRKILQGVVKAVRACNIEVDMLSDTRFFFARA
jgi:hypothetical protein